MQKKTKTSSWKFRNKPKWLVLRMIPMFSGFPHSLPRVFQAVWVFGFPGGDPRCKKIGCLQIPRVSNWFIGLCRPFLFPRTAITSINSKQVGVFVLDLPNKVVGKKRIQQKTLPAWVFPKIVVPQMDGL